jgi:hypothetical protein
MHLHGVVKIDAGAFSRVQVPLPIEEPDHMKRKPSTEATAAWIRLMRVQSRVLDCVEQDLKKAGFPPLAWYDALLELSRAPTGELRPVELERQMLIPQYSTSRLIDRLPRVQDRQARPVRRDHRSGPRAAEEDVGCLFGGDREICRLKAVRCRCRQALRSARPAGLLLRRGLVSRRQRRHVGAMKAFPSNTTACRSVRGHFIHGARSLAAPFKRNSHGA